MKKNQAGFAVIEVVVVGIVTLIVIAAVALWFNYSYKNAPTPLISQPSSSGQQLNLAITTEPAKRLVYVKDDHIWAADIDGANAVDLTAAGLQYDDTGSAFSNIRLDSDGSRVYYISKNQLWSIESDGANNHQLTNINHGIIQTITSLVLGATASYPPSKILGITPNGQSVVFQTMTTEQSSDPNTKPSIYVYKVSTGSLTAIEDPGTANYNNQVVRITNTHLIYVEGQLSKTIAAMDLDSGEKSQGYSKEFAYFTQLDLDSTGQWIAYQTGVTGDSGADPGSSQIRLYHSISQTDSDLSPQGIWAEFQCLDASPDFSYIIYCHRQPSSEAGIYNQIYYLTNNQGKTPYKLTNYDCNAGQKLWVSNSQLICKVHSTNSIVKVDFKTNTTKTILNQASALIGQ